MKRKKIITLFTIIAAISIIFSQHTHIIERFVSIAIPKRMGLDVVSSLEDGLHIALCGAGGPVPSPRSSGPCVAVIAGKQLFVVDTGTNGPRNLARMGYPPGSVRAVFLTHFHSDHIDGLGELATMRWATAENSTSLPVYGPQGVQSVVDGFNASYAQDFIYRNEHHGDQVAPMKSAGLLAISFNTPKKGTLEKVFEADELIVNSLLVDHAPVSPAVGYLFEYRGRSVLITGDTAKSKNVEQFSKGVDLLIHDALAPNLIKMMEAAFKKMDNTIMAKIMYDIPDYHASPKDAAEIAQKSEVGHLLYYHIVPPIMIPGQEALFLNGADKIFDRYTVGYDGVSFSLPAHSSEIIKTNDGI